MTRHVVFTSWSGPERLALGKHDGTTVRTGELTIERATGVHDYADPHREVPDVRFERASWTSPEVSTGFPAGDLIASWNATTPPGTWLQVEASGSLDDGTGTPWYVLGRWAETDTDILPTSVEGQDDDLVQVQADVLRVGPPRALLSYRVRVNLLRRPGAPSPSVRLVGAMASQSPDGRQVPRSPGGGAEGLLIDVPAYSQQVHRGEYPHWDSGGSSWCSPTSTTMVLAYWGRLPDPAEYAWVDPAFPDRFVDHAARHTFDYSYQGAGNWPFNTAYAGRYGVTAFVTRLRSLTEAEQFIRAGIPLVVGVSFAEEELSGAGYGTEGHLLTIVGFTEDGDVVSNDPASHGVPDNAQVRTTYDRVEFENAWLSSSGGITYVIHPPDVPLPPSPAEPNW